MVLTLDQLIRASAHTSPGAPAVLFGAERLSYQDLDARADRVAATLAAAGVEPGDRVGLYLPKGVAAVVAIAGILRRGAAYVPVDPSAPPDRARTVFEHCDTRAVVAGGAPLQALDKNLREAGAAPLPALLVAPPSAPSAQHARVVSLLEDPNAEPLRFPAPRPIGADLAYVLYTSGSTGKPKGVAITHAQSLAFVEPATAVFELTRDDVLASHAPFNFDLSVIDLFCTFSVGAAVALIPERSLAFPVKIAELIEAHGITVWNSVPSALIQLTQHGKLGTRDLSRLRLVMFAGEPYPLKHLRALRAQAPQARLLNVYGQTEANSSTYFWVDRIPDDDAAPLPIGRPFPNYEVFLLDAGGTRVTAPDVEGELFVRGGAVASGYFRDPERTTLAFVSNPLEGGRRDVVYKTGDRMRYDARGDLIFLGRADAAVKVRGFRVELGEVEAIVGAEPNVAESALVPVPDQEITNRLVLFLAPAEGATIDREAVLALLVRKVPRYMIPEQLIIEPALPRTPNGKIDRRALEPRARAALSGTS